MRVEAPSSSPWPCRLRERSAIGEVVAEYLQLRPAGADSLKGLCPFHDEKTPSFNVTPSRGLWYCFSEAQGGDVIRFVEKIDNHWYWAKSEDDLTAVKTRIYSKVTPINLNSIRTEMSTVQAEFAR